VPPRSAPRTVAQSLLTHTERPRFEPILQFRDPFRFGDHVHQLCDLDGPHSTGGVTVVYAKRPFAGPKAVLAYLSRYTHRVAISNRRLIAVDQRSVTFKIKDYRIERPPATPR
jgi:hypothetical protein